MRTFCILFLLIISTFSLQANDLAMAQRLSADASILMVDSKQEEAIPLFRQSLKIRQDLGFIDDKFYVNYTLLFLAYYDVHRECEFLKEEPGYQIRDAIRNFDKFRKLYYEVSLDCFTGN